MLLLIPLCSQMAILSIIKGSWIVEPQSTDIFRRMLLLYLANNIQGVDLSINEEGIQKARSLEMLASCSNKWTHFQKTWIFIQHLPPHGWSRSNSKDVSRFTWEALLWELTPFLMKPPREVKHVPIMRKFVYLRRTQGHINLLYVSFHQTDKLNRRCHLAGQCDCSTCKCCKCTHWLAEDHKSLPFCFLSSSLLSMLQQFSVKAAISLLPFLCSFAFFPSKFLTWWSCGLWVSWRRCPHTHTYMHSHTKLSASFWMTWLVSEREGPLLASFGSALERLLLCGSTMI